MVKSNGDEALFFEGVLTRAVRVRKPPNGGGQVASGAGGIQEIFDGEFCLPVGRERCGGVFFSVRFPGGIAIDGAARGGEIVVANAACDAGVDEGRGNREGYFLVEVWAIG
jgi:hypothetical protein